MAHITFSKALRDWFPKLFAQITPELKWAKHTWSLGGLPDNLWIRDYEPIPTRDGNIRFRYKHRSRLSAPKDKPDCDIILDGGNAVQRDGLTLMTEIVLTQNPRGTLERLQKMFGNLLLLPVEPGDDLGHADGIVHFISCKRVLINDYSVMCDKQCDLYQSKLTKRLESAGLKVVFFPYAYHKCPQMTEKQFRKAYPHGDDYGPACGYYINLLALDNLVLLPTFGFDEDEKALSAARNHFPNASVIPINCFELAMHGGLLHCVSHTAD